MLPDNKISSRQIIKMLIFEIISISMITIPGLAIKGAGMDGIFAIIIGSIAALLYGFFFLYVSKKIEGDYVENIKKILGSAGAFIICMLYIIKFIISCWFTLNLFKNVINKTVLPNTNYKIILLSFIFIGSYMAIKGIEVRARVAEVLFFIVMIPLFFIFIFGLKNIDITNMFPLFMSESPALIRTSYAVMLMYSSLEFILFIRPFITDRDSKALSENNLNGNSGNSENYKNGTNYRNSENGRDYIVGRDGKEENENKIDRYGLGRKHRKIVITVVAVSTVFNIILFVLLLGMLGVTDAGTGFSASIAILKMIELPLGFIKRQDALILMFWMFSIFTIISAYFYYLSMISERVIERKSRYGYYLFFGILIFVLCTINISPDDAMDYYIRYMAYAGMPQSVIIPLLLLVGMGCRLKK